MVHCEGGHIDVCRHPLMDGGEGRKTHMGVTLGVMIYVGAVITALRKLRKEDFFLMNLRLACDA